MKTTPHTKKLEPYTNTGATDIVDAVIGIAKIPGEIFGHNVFEGVALVGVVGTVITIYGLILHIS